MTIKHLALCVAMAAASLGAQAASSLTLTASGLSVTSTGLFRPISTSGSFKVQAQDQLGWTEAGVPAWDTLLTNSALYAAGGSTISAPLGSSAVAVAVTGTQSLTVSTPSSGGFAQAEQDFTMQFTLAAHATVTFAWDSGLSGSYSGNGTFQAMGKVSLGTSTAEFPFNENFASPPNSGSAFTGTPVHRSISFTNTSDAAVTSTYHSNIVISTREISPAAVPEPESLGLLAAGLAVTGVWLRRRRH